jgi:hypothetical protein
MKPQRIRRFLGAVCLATLVAVTTPTRAQSERDRPYELHIVVHVAQNRLLTDVFRERIERELHDGFQAALGEMGHVTVTHEHPRLGDVLMEGLQSLGSWKDREDRKTHFVLIDFSGVHYEIQARQYDGTTGRASPVVRRDRTRDRDFVSKAAALLIKQDFGFLGTVVSGPEGPQKIVKVELRGGGRGNLARWVQKDDVFALALPGGGSSAALRWAVLQVTEPPSEENRDGLCVCRFFHRYKVSSIAGYRCIKLGTVQTALRLRWMQETPRGLKPLGTSLAVEVRRHSFEGEEATKLQKNTGRNGVLDTVRDGDRGVFAHLAFVSITAGMMPPLPQVPVALVDDQPVFIEVNAARDANTLFSVSRAAWQNNVSDSLLVQVSLFRELESLAARPEQRGEAILKAERGLERSRSDRASLMEQKTALLQEAKESRARLDTAREDQRLKEMEEGERLLEQFITKQKEIDKTENDPKLKRWRSEVERAKLLEKDLEIGKAIAIYEEIQREGFQDPELDRHLKDLKRRWKPVDARHEDARAFIYRVWPTLDTSRLEENLPKARQAFLACQPGRDVITIRKLLKGTEAHADRLAKELSELKPELNAEDEKPARLIQKVSTEIVKLGKDIHEYLLKTQPDDK